MKLEYLPMTAEPKEGIPSSGRAYNFGCLVWGIIILLSLIAVPGAVVIFNEVDENPSSLIFLPIIIIWLILLTLGISQYWRKSAGKRGVDVLREVLNFDIASNYYGVGIAAFCRPDAVQPGNPTALLIFMQNYDSRPRHVIVRFSNNEVLSNLAGENRCFGLTPGQCAVYREVILIPPETLNGEHVGIARLKVKFPQGQGERLIPKSKKEARLILMRSRSIVFTIEAQPDVALFNPEDIPEPQFLSLYYPELTEPRFDVLEQISNAAPSESIKVAEI